MELLGQGHDDRAGKCEPSDIYLVPINVARNDKSRCLWEIQIVLFKAGGPVESKTRFEQQNLYATAIA